MSPFLHAAPLHAPEGIPPKCDFEKQLHFICMHIKLIPSNNNI
jgi:hypothetical protein